MLFKSVNLILIYIRDTICKLVSASLRVERRQVVRSVFQFDQCDFQWVQVKCALERRLFGVFVWSFESEYLFVGVVATVPPVRFECWVRCRSVCFEDWA